MAWPPSDSYAYHEQVACMHTVNRERVVFVLAVLDHVVWVGSTIHKGITDPGAVRGIMRGVWVIYVVTCSGR